MGWFCLTRRLHLYAGTQDENQVVFAHYHYTFTANSSVSTLRFADVFFGNADADIVVDQVSVAALPPNYTVWRNAHFTPAQQGDGNISGWSADPDGDRIANGLEFFCNTNPVSGILVADSSGLTRVTLEPSGGSQYLTFTYRRLMGWNGNAPVIAVADNLGAWDTSGNQIETVGSPVAAADGLTETIKIRLKTPVTPALLRKFIRLQLVQ